MTVCLSPTPTNRRPKSLWGSLTWTPASTATPMCPRKTPMCPRKRFRYFSERALQSTIKIDDNDRDLCQRVFCTRIDRRPDWFQHIVRIPENEAELSHPVSYRN